MHLIQKIKSYYIQHDFYLWRDFNPSESELSFSAPDDEVLMDMGLFIRERMRPTMQPGNERHRLLPDAAEQFMTIDGVLGMFRLAVMEDLKETGLESGLYNWDFRYRFDFHPKCEDTITVSTVLKSNDKKGYCVYNVASVRLFDGVYYCWDHLR